MVAEAVTIITSMLIIAVYCAIYLVIALREEIFLHTLYFTHFCAQKYNRHQMNGRHMIKGYAHFTQYM